MNDNKFITALNASFKKECEEIEALETNKYKFTEKFEKKMEKLIRRREKPYYSIISTAARRAACVAAAVIMVSASALTPKAGRQTVYTFDTNDRSTMRKYTVNDKDLNGAPETIEEEYYIPNIPEDFELDNYYNFCDLSISTDYSTKYPSSNKYIYFQQVTKKNFGSAFDYEYSTHEYIDDKDWQRYVLITREEEPEYCTDGYTYIIVWDDGDYIFTLGSNLDKETVLNLCKSIKVK